MGKKARSLQKMVKTGRASGSERGREIYNPFRWRLKILLSWVKALKCYAELFSRALRGQLQQELVIQQPLNGFLCSFFFANV
jgi:hypothetical protein